MGLQAIWGVLGSKPVAQRIRDLMSSIAAGAANGSA